MVADPLTIGFAVVGTALDIFGGLSEADAADEMRSAELRADAALTTNTKQQNALYKQLARADYEVAQRKKETYQEYAKDFTAGAKLTTQRLNNFIKKSTEAKNKASDAQAQSVEAEVQQGRLNNIRERRENVRAMLATQSAIIAGAANKGATGGSGFQAGKADATAQTARAQVASFQNLSILDQIDSANKLYAAALTEANDYEAKALTEQNRWNYQKTRLDLALQQKYMAAEVSGQKKSTAITERIYDKQTEAATIQSTRNRQVASAKDQMEEGQTISNIGSSLTNFGLNLFG